MSTKLKVDKYNQLWLKWSKVSHKGNGIVVLKNPEFFGPVLADCAAMDPQGHILLDLTCHFLVIIPKPYIIKLSWDKVLSQDTTSIKFDKITLEDTELGHLSKLTDKDFILLDCKGHTVEEESKGNYKMSYSAILYNSSMVPYDFSK